MTSRLLGDLDPNTTRLVRRTLATLSDVDPLERTRAIQAFTGTVRQMSTGGDASGDEMLLTTVSARNTGRANERVAGRTSIPPTPTVERNLTSHPSTSDPSTSATSGSSHSSLEFLADIEDDTLVGLVAGEHPQTVALVLASIAPAQAARVLPRLDPQTRLAAIERISRLGEIPDDSMGEIAAHLRQRVAAVDRRAIAPGQRRLDAILAAISSGRDDDSIALDHRNAKPTVSEILKKRTIDLERSESAVAKKIVASKSDTTPPSQSQTTEKATSNVASWSTDEIHSHLIRMKPGHLREALASVDTRDALLAMCGLPSPVAESVIATLPRLAAKQIRKELLEIGPLELREIDMAKERVAEASLVRPSTSSRPAMLAAA
jgi:flagellar motor switch protein FliG